MVVHLSRITATQGGEEFSLLLPGQIWAGLVGGQKKLSRDFPVYVRHDLLCSASPSEKLASNFRAVTREN
jgi:hypothetical protein